MTEKFQNKYRIKSSRLRHWDYTSSGFYFVTICTKDKICYFGDISNGKMELNNIGEIVKSEWLKTFEMRLDMNLAMGEYIIMPNHFHAIICIGDNEYNTQSVSKRRDAMHCVSTNQNNENKNVDFKKHEKHSNENDKLICPNGMQNGNDINIGIDKIGRDGMHSVSTTNMHSVSTTNMHSVSTTNMQSKSTLPSISDFTNTNQNNESHNKFGPQSKNLASIIRGFKIGVTKNARQIDPNFSWQTRFHDHIIRNEKSFYNISNYIKNNPLNWEIDNYYL